MNRLLVLAALCSCPLPSWAAVCATIDSGNVVVANLTPAGDCTSLIILDSSDWVGTSVWAIPTVSDIALVWSSAFILPVTLFLITWAIGRIVNLFR